MENTPAAFACSCETLIAARCNHLKMEINDKPHLALSEKPGW